MRVIHICILQSDCVCTSACIWEIAPYWYRSFTIWRSNRAPLIHAAVRSSTELHTHMVGNNNGLTHNSRSTASSRHCVPQFRYTYATTAAPSVLRCWAIYHSIRTRVAPPRLLAAAANVEQWVNINYTNWSLNKWVYVERSPRITTHCLRACNLRSDAMMRCKCGNVRAYSIENRHYLIKINDFMRNVCARWKTHEWVKCLLVIMLNKLVTVAAIHQYRMSI